MKKIVFIFLIALNCAINAMAQTPTLIEFQINPCEWKESVNLHLYQKRIISQLYRADTLEITLTTVLNCCEGDTGMLKYSPDTLYFDTGLLPTPVVDDKGDTVAWDDPEWCDCKCCFTMTYVVAGLPQNDYVIVMKGTQLELKPNKYIEPSFTVKNGDTLFYHDAEGYQYIYSYYGNGQISFMKKERYPNHFWYSYFKNGNLKYELEFHKDIDVCRYIEYNESGQLIKYKNTLVTENYKTFSGNNFAPGDKMLTPEIIFSCDGGQRVLPEYEDSVKVIADFLKDHPGMRIEIGVHTNYRGDAMFNDSLSHRHARSVKDVLVSLYEIDPARIEIKGYGEQQLLIPEKETDAAPTKELKEAMHRINRRVEVKIIQVQ